MLLKGFHWVSDRIYTSFSWFNTDVNTIYIKLKKGFRWTWRGLVAFDQVKNIYTDLTDLGLVLDLSHVSLVVSVILLVIFV